MNKSLALAAACAAVLLGAGVAQAGTTTETFDTPVVTGPTEAPGVWYTDRFAPSGFATSGGVLNETINGADFQDPATRQFYNTQGRKLDLAPGVTQLSIDLFVDPNFVGSDQRLAGLWGTAVDGANNVSAFPIVELTDDGGVLRFRGFNTDVGGWTDLGAAATGWQTLSITLDSHADMFNYSVDGLSGSAAGNGSLSISNVILQGYNAGATYNVEWDNLTTGTAGVPEPATWGLMILGFGGVGAAMRRRTAKAALAA